MCFSGIGGEGSARPVAQEQRPWAHPFPHPIVVGSWPWPRKRAGAVAAVAILMLGAALLQACGPPPGVRPSPETNQDRLKVRPSDPRPDIRHDDRRQLEKEDPFAPPPE